MIKRRIKSFYYAYKGLYKLITTQPNARIHFVAAVLVIAAGFFWRVTPGEWCLLVLAIALVYCAEGFNTALEILTDLVSPDFNPMAGSAKDVAAGGVLVAAIGAGIVGLIVFLPKLAGMF